MKSEQQIILDTLKHLCDIEPGYVWTEYDWRMVLQLKQDFDELFMKDTTK